MPALRIIMRRVQQQLLSSLLRRTLQKASPAASLDRHLPDAAHSSQHHVHTLSRACASMQQQDQRSGRIEAFLALAGSLAVYGYLQPTASALAAEPQPSGDPQLQAAAGAAAAPDLYAIPKATTGVPKEVILYQYDVCPFCCKVKAVLDYYRIPYRCVEVGPLMKAELKWSQYKKVPVVLLDGEVIRDSSAIISRVAAEKDAEAAASVPAPQRGWFGRSSQLKADAASSQHTEEEARWRKWVDQRLVRVVTINIYRNRQESFQTFDYITQQGNFNWLEREAGRIIGAATMWCDFNCSLLHLRWAKGMVSGRLRKKYGIEGEAREELYTCAKQWTDALAGRDFLGGSVPNLADLSVFGATRSITGTDTFMDLMHNGDIVFSQWYERMMAAVGSSCRLPE